MEKRSKVTEENHVQNMLSFFHDCWEKELYFDVTVQVGDKTYKTHRLVLAMVSEYFRVFMQMDGQGKDILNIDDQNIPSDVFEQILHYAYTGTIDFTDCKVDVKKLTEVSDFLGARHVKRLCEINLITKLSKENAISSLVYSDFYTLPELYANAKLLLTQHYATFCHQKDFFEIPPRTLKQYLNDDELRFYKYDHIPLNSVDREKLILKSVLNYINENIGRAPDQTGELIGLLEAVKLPEFEMKYLEKKVSGLGNLKNNKKVHNMISKAHLIRAGEMTADVPEFWKTQRKLSHSFEMIQKLAVRDRVGRKKFIRFNEDEKLQDPYVTMRDITIWIRRWDGRPVIGAITVVYDNGLTYHAGEENTSRLESSQKICLEDGEVITKVTAFSGYMVDSLKFETNKGKTFGPYGGEGGRERICNASKLDSYLHSIVGASVMTQDMKGIVHLGFRWVRFF